MMHAALTLQWKCLFTSMLQDLLFESSLLAPGDL